MENHEDLIQIRVEGGEGEAGNQAEEFKQFDIILTADEDNTIDDHNYASWGQQTKYSSQTTKRIMKEWKILEESLPDSIYVRAYEGRIDLLRAVIVGPAGTPYQDGLFFFDIHFPSDYPNRPPEFHYHSFGFRLNPNLYQLGKVCLSILNTTDGSVTEIWNPFESTVLQVLVSIQALVLNAKPYFNYTSLHSTQENETLIYLTWEKESLAYNEDTFVLNYKKMLAVINRPPRHFESFVAQHFRYRAETISTACKAYIDDDDAPPLMKVVVDGDHPIQNNILFSSATATNPKRFQNLMRIIYSRLVKAFIKNGSSSLENYVGSDVGDYVDERVVEPRLRGRIHATQIHLSDFIRPLFTLYLMFFYIPTLLFVFSFFK